MIIFKYENCNSARILFPNAPNSQKQVVNNSEVRDLFLLGLELSGYISIHLNMNLVERVALFSFIHSFLLLLEGVLLLGPIVLSPMGPKEWLLC